MFLFVLCTMCSVNYVSICFNVINDFMFMSFFILCLVFHLETNNGSIGL
jgi:hypothetical protein